MRLGVTITVAVLTCFQTTRALADAIAFEPAAVSIEMPPDWNSSSNGSTLTLTKIRRDVEITFVAVPAGSVRDAATRARGALSTTLKNLNFTPEQPANIGGMQGVAFSGHGLIGTTNYSLVLLALDTPAQNDLLVIALDRDADFANDKDAITYVLTHLHATAAQTQRVQQPQEPPPIATDQVSLTALAPDSITLDDLGKPCDEKFQLLTGANAGRVYEPGTNITAASSVKIDYTMIDNTRALDANASVLGLLSFGGTKRQERRYWVFRASETTQIARVNDQADVSRQPPGNARWYIAEIHFGHSYDVVFDGARNSFTAGIAGALQQFSGGVNSFRDAAKLSWHLRGRGIQPINSEDLIISPDPGALVRVYKRTAEAAPIWVVYRSIPGRILAPSHSIDWDDVVVEHNALRCSCVEGHSIELVCRAHNNGSRAVDVSILGKANTATFGYPASGAGRLTVPQHGTRDVSVVAPIDGAMFNCDNAANCECEFSESYSAP
jgi:hypothetical protein